MKETYYFSHDTNAAMDPKIRWLISEHGISAYGTFWIIIEMLASQRDYKTKLQTLAQVIYPLIQGRHLNYQSDGGVGIFLDEKGDSIPFEQAHLLSICLARVEAMLQAMIKIGLITTDGDMVWSDSLNERMEKKSQISEKRVIAGRMGGLARASKHLLSKGSSKTNQVKESKVKENKGKENRGEEDIPSIPNPGDLKKERKLFKIPTTDEVTAYCDERNNTIDPHRFVSHYESNGWMVGKNHMKDWKAAVRNWEGNDFGNGNGEKGGQSWMEKSASEIQEKIAKQSREQESK